MKHRSERPIELLNLLLEYLDILSHMNGHFTFLSPVPWSLPSNSGNVSPYSSAFRRMLSYQSPTGGKGVSAPIGVKWSPRNKLMVPSLDACVPFALYNLFAQLFTIEPAFAGLLLKLVTCFHLVLGTSGRQ